MNIKEIVYCYVHKDIAMPEDFIALRASFVDNGFSEKKIGPQKWLYKRGAMLALEFNYQSEALEIQVIVQQLGKEQLGQDLRISVGNWGFPFEPLMMKKRFQKYLDLLSDQIDQHGFLEHKPEEVQKIARLSKKKRNHAWLLIACALIGILLLELFSSM